MKRLKSTTTLKSSIFGPALSALTILGSAFFAQSVLAQELALQTQLDELRRSNESLKQLLIDQQARMDAIEQQMKLAAPAATAQARNHSSKNPADLSKAPLDYQTPEETDASLFTMKRSGETGSALQLYGFARVDAIYDDHQAGLDELLGYALSDDVAAESSDFYLHPKLTRLGVDMGGPDIDAFGGAELTGKLEIDFYRQFRSSESRDEFRMRHAWLKLSGDEWYMMGGQTFDTISPLYPAVNPDAGGWGIGNLGDRRPQFILGYTPSLGDGKLSLVGSIGQSGANSSSQGDDNANYQGRLSYKHPIFESNLEIGLWGHSADEDGFDSEAYGIDLTLPLGSALTLKGEVWGGQNLDDVRGGVWQNGVNLLGNEISSQGGWIELMWKLNSRVSAHAGYMIDDPDDGDLSDFSVDPNFARAKNEAFYGALRFNFDPFAVGLDYIHLDTDYVGANSGSVNRIQTYIQYNF